MMLYSGRLTVVPDNTTKGSEGRLCLQFPVELRELIGQAYRTVGVFAKDNAIILVPDESGSVVTPRAQLWWKNGVRDHKIRRNWRVSIYLHQIRNTLFVALYTPTSDPVPDLPMPQETFF